MARRGDSDELTRRTSKSSCLLDELITCLCYLSSILLLLFFLPSFPMSHFLTFHFLSELILNFCVSVKRSAFTTIIEKLPSDLRKPSQTKTVRTRSLAHRIHETILLSSKWSDHAYLHHPAANRTELYHPGDASSLS